MNPQELEKVKVWAVEQLARMDRQKKRMEMMNLMMGAMNRVSQPAVKQMVSKPNKLMKSSVEALEKSNREWPAKYQEAIDKMEAALTEERRKTALLRAWLEELSR